jgi:hypothetical protein
MTRTIQIAKDVRFPLDIAGQCLALFGIRGSGKTNTAGAFVEELLEHGYPTVIIDPTDAWWGLRVGADGDPKKGYPVVIFGGSHGDIPLEESSGKVIADFVVKEQVPIILSIRHLRKGAQRRFVREFCEELYQLKGEPQYRTPLAVVIDEAPLFAPQKVIGDMAFVVSAVEDLIARGRTSGFGVVLISQRSATLNADVRTQADTMICHRLTAKLDRKAIVEWFEENASTEDLKTILQSLAKLQDGEGWVWAPKLDIMKRAQMRRRRTFDSSATPKLGEKIRPPKKLADIDLDKLKNQMAAVIERAKADDPKALRARIAELERQVKAKAPAPAPAPKAPKMQRVEVPVLSAKDRKLLDRVASRAADHAAAATTHANATTGLTKTIVQLIAKVAAATCPEVPPGPPRSSSGSHSAHSRGDEEDLAIVRERRNEPSTAWDRIRTGLTNGGAQLAFAGQSPVDVRTLPRTPDGGELGELAQGQRKVLTAVAQHTDGVTPRLLVAVTGYAMRSIQTHLSALRVAGLVVTNQGVTKVTTVGMAALPRDFEPLPTGAALREHALSILPEGERRVLSVLIENLPKPVSVIDICRLTEYAARSVQTHVSALVSRRYADRPQVGYAAVSKELL